MRILCLNGNTTTAITTRVAQEMRRTLGDGREVVECTPVFGPAVIKTRIDLCVATHAIVDAAMSASDIQGIMLAVSFDTGRDALREALGLPVIGMTEASVAVARMRGRRIGYVSLGRDITPLYWENLGHCHIKEDMAAWEDIEAPSAYTVDAHTEADRILIEACEKLRTKGADVIVLLGAVLAGAACRIQKTCDIPVVDGGIAGALMIRAMVDFYE